MSESVIKVENLVKSFGDHEVLKKIDFEISKGEVVCIIGSSGSGKSTLLRCINHLETPTSGKILFHGEEVKNTQSSLTKYRSQVGMVFQSFNLFNNMTVLKNCSNKTLKGSGNGSLYKCPSGTVIRWSEAESCYSKRLMYES